MFKTLAKCVSVALFLASPAAATTILTFDNGTPEFTGTNNLTGYTLEIRPGVFLEFDVSFSGSNASGANLFETLNCPVNGGAGNLASCAGTDDGDLVPATQGENGVAGNVLILQETGATLDDDASNGGTITFTLVSGPSFSVLGYSAIDDEEFSFTVGTTTYGPVGNTLNSETLATTFPAPSPLIGVGGSFTVTFFGSGGVDSIILSAVPLPAGALLLLGGFGAMVALRRRGKAQAV